MATAAANLLVHTNTMKCGHAESLQFRWGKPLLYYQRNRSSANPNTAVKNHEICSQGIEESCTAAVLVGMLLMYNPSRHLADSLGRVRCTMPPCSEPDWERLTASQHATMSKLAAASLWIVIYPLMVTDKLGMNSAQNYLDQLSHQERFNFYELVNMNNLKRKRSRGRKSAKKIQDEYMEVTILVAVDGKHELLAINSVDT
ncbi:hypothetical protein M0R45_024145 [Rubus argutus]|uniref:Uncharacterized protein n=1 Tax=Rubus argutus TaxID=59490 RepID=A0AAW1WTE4_RUBAR